RELENAVFRAVVAARGPFLTSVDFPVVEPSGVPRFGPRPYLPKDEGIQGFPPPQPAPPSSGVPIPSNLPRNPVTMEDYERAAILLALEAENGNIKAAADRLEMARSTLYRRIKALNIPVPD
ncbi:MAG: hypothetical protein L6R30_14105, partial [Thermoanaerobaculia bacterium]|nr:hypothetical protein [Thermoanaerobaculia bacterium]